MPAKSDSSPSVSPADANRVLIATRLLDAPRELVFQLWTDPQHLAQWWGPRGFITTTFEQSLRPRGVWRLVMLGPDGRDYHNRVTYLEVNPPSRLVFQHSGGADVEPSTHKTIVDFADEAGKTRLTMQIVFESAEILEEIIRKYQADRGLAETLDRLGEHVAAARSGNDDFIISRVFDAPRELVWSAWTQEDHLAKWFGPKGISTNYAKLDLHPGGMFHYSMKTPDGLEIWGRFVYREILPKQRLVWVNSFSDKDAGITRHPWNADWPLELLTTVTFAEHAGKTTVTVRWSPIGATDAERKAFRANRDSMNKGWGGSFEVLAEYLATQSG